MNPIATEVSSRIEQILGRCAIHMLPVVPILRARTRAITHRSRYIPVGGSVPLGVLGHLNAALELASQIENGELPLPERVVLPMGTGGTAAGLLLGFAIAGLDIEVVGVRTGPRAFANKRAVVSLAKKTQRLINAVCDTNIDAVHSDRMRVVHTAYGGAYGRPVPRAREMKKLFFDETGIVLDDTYTAKAWAGALQERKTFTGPMLFWYTFDPSCLTSSRSTSIPATATQPAMSITR
jgi:D-cysteine desulfhydrase